MLSHPGELGSQDVAGMGREDLIRTLLELNTRSTFRFTPGWLKKQRTERLRTLLLSTYQQYDARDT